MNLHVNLVMNTWRKSMKRHAKKQIACRWCFRFIILSFIVRSGESKSLKELLLLVILNLVNPIYPIGMSAKHPMVSQPQGRGMIERVEDVEKGECLAVMAGIGPSTLYSSRRKAKRQSLYSEWHDCRVLLIQPTEERMRDGNNHSESWQTFNWSAEGFTLNNIIEMWRLINVKH